MPHLIIEFSGNLEADIDVQGLIDRVHQAAIGSGQFEVAAIRTRAVARKYFKIADADPRYGFINIIARIRPGRSLVDKQEIGAILLEAASSHVDPLFMSHPIALNLEIHETDPTMTFRRNTIDKPGSATRPKPAIGSTEG